MAYLSQTSADSDSVTITCFDLDGKHARTRYFWWQIFKGRGGQFVAEGGSTTPPYTTAGAFTFSGLQSGYYGYYVLCGIYDDAARTRQLAELGLDNVYTAAGEIQKVYVFTNGVWVPATAYIFTGGGWRAATPEIYSSGWN